MINIEEFDSNLLKLDKKSYKDINIYYIGYITIKKLVIMKIFTAQILCIWWEKDGNKYLVFDSTDENEEVLEKYTELWDGIKNEIKTINGGKKGGYGKDFMKIKFDTDDDLPLNKPLKLHMLTIIVRSVFEEDSKFYPQLYLDEYLSEL